jgi:glutamyl-tRNA synthetase
MPYSDQELPAVVDILRLRMSTLNDFATLCRSFFTGDYEMNPAALEKLNAPGAREGLRELGSRLEATSDFTEAGIEAELRKIAEERGLKAGILINGSRAALTGQPVGPSAFHVFTALGRKKSIERLLAV